MEFGELYLAVLPILKAGFEKHQEHPYARHKNGKFVRSPSHVTLNPENLQWEEMMPRMSKPVER